MFWCFILCKGLFILHLKSFYSKNGKYIYLYISINENLSFYIYPNLDFDNISLSFLGCTTGSINSGYTYTSYRFQFYLHSVACPCPSAAKICCLDITAMSFSTLGHFFNHMQKSHKICWKVANIALETCSKKWYDTRKSDQELSYRVDVSKPCQ